jgi:hypothetical protein
MDYGTKKRRTEAFCIVKKVFDAIDPYQLIEHGAPDDEFESEIEEIVAAISLKSSPVRIAKIISCVINKGFKLGTTYKQFSKQGKSIYQSLHTDITADSKNRQRNMNKPGLYANKHKKYNLTQEEFDACNDEIAEMFYGSKIFPDEKDAENFAEAYRKFVQKCNVKLAKSEDDVKAGRVKSIEGMFDRVKEEAKSIVERTAFKNGEDA